VAGEGLFTIRKTRFLEREGGSGDETRRKHFRRAAVLFLHNHYQSHFKFSRAALTLVAGGRVLLHDIVCHAKALLPPRLPFVCFLVYE
jgi:hypothetical protein